MTEASGPGLAEAPSSPLGRALGYVPRALASHAHVLLLIALGAYLIVLPLAGVAVSSGAELVGGNYCNVTSDIGACIAAGGTLTLLRHSRRRNRLAEASHQIIADLYRHSAGRSHPAEIPAAVPHPPAGAASEAAGGTAGGAPANAARRTTRAPKPKDAK